MSDLGFASNEVAVFVEMGLSQGPCLPAAVAAPAPAGISPLSALTLLGCAENSVVLGSDL